MLALPSVLFVIALLTNPFCVAISTVDMLRDSTFAKFAVDSFSNSGLVSFSFEDSSVFKTLCAAKSLFSRFLLSSPFVEPSKNSLLSSPVLTET